MNFDNRQTVMLNSKPAKQRLKPSSPPSSDTARIWKDLEIGLVACDAHYSKHVFPLHAHDYYVIGVITEGHQTFLHRRKEYHTPPGGMILFNPEDDHTGKPAGDQGFRWRAVYPDLGQMREAAEQLGLLGRSRSEFSQVRVDDREALIAFNQLHSAISTGSQMMVKESLYVQFLSLMLARHSNKNRYFRRDGLSGWVCAKAKRFLLDNLANNPGLGEVAAHIGIDRFRLIREFNRHTGLSPHAYFECLRIREAQRLIDNGYGLADVAAMVGFTDQSHFTRRFKRQLGVTPGKYLRG
jgi:AraC-like DNA-binding protein